MSLANLIMTLSRELGATSMHLQSVYEYHRDIQWAFEAENSKLQGEKAHLQKEMDAKNQEIENLKNHLFLMQMLIGLPSEKKENNHPQ